ncbi:hypothetical protein BKA62DRAFT_834835 [Auriculariales sp. MPI-PUGE-AT-0066]|nr:hypothetical protein BKA62DRAFT_834835 [Auriculariales sp. MPI-PUGE-AT-0066]
MDPILLTFNGNGGLVTSILKLQVIVYGALLGGARDPVLRTLDDTGRSLPLSLDDSAINAAGAACDVILAQEYNLEYGVHTLELTPYGGFEQIMAIFSAKIFDAPLVTTTSSAPSTKPTSTPGSSSHTATPPSSNSRSGSELGSLAPSSETSTGSDVSSGTHDREASRASQGRSQPRLSLTLQLRHSGLFLLPMERQYQSQPSSYLWC